MSNLYVCKEYEDMYSEGFKIVRTIEEHNKIIYNQALEDIFNLAKQNSYDDGVDYSIGLQKLDELIANISK